MTFTTVRSDAVVAGLNADCATFIASSNWYDRFTVIPFALFEGHSNSVVELLYEHDDDAGSTTDVGAETPPTVAAAPAAAEGVASSPSNVSTVTGVGAVLSLHAKTAATVTTITETLRTVRRMLRLSSRQDDRR
jgi:hypothetical protein